MIRTKKIRGHKQIWKRIEHWKTNAKHLDLDELESRKREYTKVYVFPYFSIDYLKSVTPSPSGVTKSRITHALFEIYNAWKEELEKSDEPYYLKIWFFPENVGKSQVVCAIGEMIDWYEETFYKPDNTNEKKPDMSIFGDASVQAGRLSWEYALDELSIDDEYLGDMEDWETEKEYYESRRWLKRKLKKPHREIQHGEQIYLNFPQYTVWLGGN